jgi:hypothetical protein
LKGCFFTVFLRTVAPSVGPLDEREMLLPVSDLPPPLVLPLLAGLTTVRDWTNAWQFGHLVVLAEELLSLGHSSQYSGQVLFPQGYRKALFSWVNDGTGMLAWHDCLSRAWKGDAGLVHGLYPVSRYPDLALLAHAWAQSCLRRITISLAEGKVRVTVGGKIVAESTRAILLEEKGYPPVHYLPHNDADMSLLARTTHYAYCPYKGDCTYYSIPVGGAK